MTISQPTKITAAARKIARLCNASGNGDGRVTPRQAQDMMDNFWAGRVDG